MGRKINNEIFIDECNKIHNNKYDYSLIVYKKAKNIVKVICPKHGVFEQLAFHHKKGKGCPKCAYDKLRDNNFIEKSKKNYGDLYDYSLVNYTNNRTKVKIVCSKHGIFEQVPQSHLNGFGCKKCSIENGKYSVAGGVGGGGWKPMHTIEKFIEKSIKIHGDKYNYSLVDYYGSNVKVKIVCSKHGIFEQTPRHHLYNRGCPKCNYSKGEIFIEDFLKKNNISFEPQKRFSDCRDKMELHFDFYLPDHNLCVEYDGIQHFEEVEYWGGLEYLNDVKKKDKIKNIYCDVNNIKLVRIKYDENIIKKLKNNLHYG